MGASSAAGDLARFGAKPITNSEIVSAQEFGGRHTPFARRLKFKNVDDSANDDNL